MCCRAWSLMRCLSSLSLRLRRGDTVRLETYFQEDGRISTRRDWRITDATTGRYLGAATRWVMLGRGAGMGVWFFLKAGSSR